MKKRFPRLLREGNVSETGELVRRIWQYGRVIKLTLFEVL